MVLLPDTDLIGAEFIAKRIRSLIESLQVEHPDSDVSPFVAVSIGVACMRPSANRFPESLLDLADKALFLAKESGRNRIHTSK